MISNLILSNNAQCDARAYSPLALAFIGDTVFDLLVREMLLREANRPVGQLHKLAVERVCAAAQAAAVKELLAHNGFTEEELAVFKRGRNAHAGHSPKHATEADYHAATGLEAVFGYLYLCGEYARLHDLFAEICAAATAGAGQKTGAVHETV